MTPLNIALCYESVIPARGGAETYIADLARRLTQDGHDVHLYASRWDETALPSSMSFHPIKAPRGLRFSRPWQFATNCLEELQRHPHDVSIGFNKTWGQDLLYPQGGLHAASRYHNRLKYPNTFLRALADLGRFLDPADWSFRQLERKQYLGAKRPVVIVNSRMVQRHFQKFLGYDPATLRVVHSAIDPTRFSSENREGIRMKIRASWGVPSDEAVGLFVATNYRLKGLGPLIRATAKIANDSSFRMVIVGNSRYTSYETLAAKLGVSHRFHFVGFLRDPRECYFGADYLIHPTFYDPCSLVVLEALACGLPVITSKYNGASELYDVPDAGLIIDDPHDACGLANNIVQMLDPRYRENAAVAARQNATRWTFDHHYRQLLAIFHEIKTNKDNLRSLHGSTKSNSS